jgi:23S rRNA pseudouridine1911/1915/1917 synthase
VHLAASGHPIIGDALYGITGPWVGRHALHAWSLQLQHPITKQPLQLHAPLPDDLLHLARLCGLAMPRNLQRG